MRGWTLTSRHSPWGRLGHYGMFADEHKRQGLGGRLLKLCIDAVRKTGAEAMFIDTGPSIAHRVYEKYGFRGRGERPSGMAGIGLWRREDSGVPRCVLPN